MAEFRVYNALCYDEWGPGECPSDIISAHDAETAAELMTERYHRETGVVRPSLVVVASDNTVTRWDARIVVQNYFFEVSPADKDSED